MAKLLCIEWEDSAQPSPGWRYLNEPPPLEAVRCYSVGWLVAENERVVMLAPNLGDVDSDDGAQGSGFIRIPVSAIVRSMELQDPTSSCDPP